MPAAYASAWRLDSEPSLPTRTGWVECPPASGLALDASAITSSPMCRRTVRVPRSYPVRQLSFLLGFPGRAGRFPPFRRNGASGRTGRARPAHLGYLTAAAAWRAGGEEIRALCELCRLSVGRSRLGRGNAGGALSGSHPHYGSRYGHHHVAGLPLRHGCPGWRSRSAASAWDVSMMRPEHRAPEPLSVLKPPLAGKISARSAVLGHVLGDHSFDRRVTWFDGAGLVKTGVGVFLHIRGVGRLIDLLDSRQFASTRHNDDPAHPGRDPLGHNNAKHTSRHQHQAGHLKVDDRCSDPNRKRQDRPQREKQQRHSHFIHPPFHTTDRTARKPLLTQPCAAHAYVVRVCREAAIARGQAVGMLPAGAYLS